MLKALTNWRTLFLSGAFATCLVLSSSLSQAQDAVDFPSPAADQQAQPAPAASPTVSIEDRVASLEAYINNTDGTKGLPGISGPGHNAWMMTSAALVLFMTLPGLALFYGGLVRKKNVLSVFAQCLGCAGLVTLLWWAFGYSLVFGKNFSNPFFGGSEFLFLQGVTSAPNTDYSYWVSQNIYAMYQLMFAIITPALIVGAIAERMKYTAIMAFIGIWMFLVYFPMAHMVWGASGFMNGIYQYELRNQGDRLCWRNGGAYDFRMERSDPLLDLGSENWFQERTDGSSQPRSLYGWHRYALGRLVWI